MTHQSHPNDPPPAGDELLTISEVAAIVRAPLATLRYWRHLGTGPRSFRLGRRVAYRLGDLRAWIDAQADASDAWRSNQRTGITQQNTTRGQRHHRDVACLRSRKVLTHGKHQQA